MAKIGPTCLSVYSLLLEYVRNCVQSHDPSLSTEMTNIYWLLLNDCSLRLYARYILIVSSSLFPWLSCFVKFLSLSFSVSTFWVESCPRQVWIHAMCGSFGGPPKLSSLLFVKGDIVLFSELHHQSFHAKITLYPKLQSKTRLVRVVAMMIESSSDMPDII